MLNPLKKTNNSSMTVPVVNVLQYEVYSGSLAELPLAGPCVVINTLNAYSYVMAKNDIRFRNALKNSTILVADGFPVVLAARILKAKKIQKIAGADIFYHLLDYLNANSRTCFFLGSSSSTLLKIKDRLALEYPHIRTGFCSPPFKNEFSEADNKQMIDEINRFSPDVLFVGMTAPKQEKWVHAHFGRINAHIIASIGAVFDFYAQTKPRPSAFWIKLNLEWFIRLVREPKRMWKRYLLYSPLFIIDVLRHKFSR
jgi:N-acetylglucosaminyldiphosphoundecaprenol N-acetyl-beta-D-mannosaminyltransferase